MVRRVNGWWVHLSVLLHYTNQLRLHYCLYVIYSVSEETVAPWTALSSPFVRKLLMRSTFWRATKRPGLTISFLLCSEMLVYPLSMHLLGMQPIVRDVHPSSVYAWKELDVSVLVIDGLVCRVHAVRFSISSWTTFTTLNEWEDFHSIGGRIDQILLFRRVPEPHESS